MEFLTRKCSQIRLSNILKMFFTQINLKVWIHLHSHRGLELIKAEGVHLNHLTNEENKRWGASEVI